MAPFTRADMIRTANLSLEPAGYHRKNLTWYSRSDEIIRMFALDKSSFGALYIIFLAVSITKLKENPFPKWYAADWRRALKINHSDGMESIVAVDLERTTFPDGIQRTSRGKPSYYYCPTLDNLRYVIEHYAIPFLDLMKNREGVLKLYNEGKLWPVPAALQRALGLRE